MFCTQCGHQNPDGSRFCSRCGAALTRAGAGAEGAVETTSTISLAALEGALDNEAANAPAVTEPALPPEGAAGGTDWATPWWEDSQPTMADSSPS